MKELKNTSYAYGCISKIFHWTMAILIMGMLGMGLFLDDIPKEIKPTIMLFHKSIGFTLLLLAMLRLFWKVKNVTPRIPDTLTSVQKKLAKGTHHLLYLLMVMMPLSGVLFVWFYGNSVPFFGLFEVPSFMPVNREIGQVLKESHELIAWGFIGLLILHSGAALYHHFILKDDTLKRMTK